MKLFIFLLFILHLGIYSEEEILKIYAMVYGKSSYPTELINSNDGTKYKNILWCFYYIETDSKKILVDTGFTEEKYIKGFSIQNYIHPKNLLEAISIKTEEISDIIITHSHFDHIGGAYLFPNAKIYINQKELESFTNQSRFKDYEKVFDIRKFRNSIIQVGPNYYFSNYLNIYLSGGHTVGSQYIHIKFTEKEFIITGDECYLSVECLKGVGLNPKAAFSKYNNTQFLKKINQLYTKNPKLEILTLHDTNIILNYKQIQNGVIEIYTKK